MIGSPLMRADAPPAPTIGESGKAPIDLGDRVQQYVRGFFPGFKKTVLVDPPHIDLFYDGLKALALQQSQPGAGKETLNRITIENRKAVCAYLNSFDAGQAEKVYLKPVDRALALCRSSEILEKDIAVDPTDKAILNHALNAAFTSVTGLNTMSTQAFMQSMMLGDEEFEIEKEW